MSAITHNRFGPRYLREMLITDLPEVFEGEISSYPYPWTKGNFKDCLKNHKVYSCWVYETDSEIQAHVILSIVAAEAHILNLCVYPTLQGKGWGKRLLEDIEAILSEHQVKTCFLEVRPSNKVGLWLYRNAGFNEIGIRNKYYPADDGREDAIVMAKTYFV